ncbi:MULTISPECIES: IclR family transcriptional regulator [Halococcus]|uniref:Transcription regulator n=1 Tax=Halococcus salifodinae DSM 8989 TaxID=1227456 RepID=M0NEM2_9EURY|nr:MULTISPECIES: IclR family transcriptional regulator [Halococcus]EMA55135.1 transcription regulator [Halococcus salifodinae DSM 8989]
MSDDPKQKTIGAVETSFDILGVLSDIEPAGVSEITEELDMSTSTVFAHLNTLLQQGYLVKNDTTYRRSLRFLADAGAIRQRCEAAQLLDEKVDELASMTGEIAGAATEERGQRVMLFRSAGEMAAGDKIPIGEHSYLHWTSLGKALLAHLPAARRSEIVDRHDLPRGTERTFTTRDALGDELERIRQQGYAVDDEEHLRGVRGVAVPVFNTEDDVIASVGLTGPRNRFQSSYLTELLSSLEYVKNEIEVRNQYYE